LFLLYINDIDYVCCGNTKLVLFADDAKLYSSVNVDTASLSLQQSLTKLCSWANDWQLTINVSKCAVLSVGNNSLSPSNTYFINGMAITQKDSYTDLGITVKQDLSFHTHINNIVAKARNRLSTLFRGFVTRNCDIMCRAFAAYIRPLLEYNTLVWSPCAIYLIDLVESVQRNFSKRILNTPHLTYAERLALLNLDTLELRRLRFDLIFYYKVYNNLTPFDPKVVFTVYSPPSNLRNNTPYVIKPAKLSRKVLSTVFYRSIDAWNALPLDLRSASSLAAFKRGLKSVDMSRFLKGSFNSSFM
jgi:hypothetical protein